jgi:glycosyltransferase involved in cell wall biosynthesis
MRAAEFDTRPDALATAKRAVWHDSAVEILLVVPLVRSPVTRLMRMRVLLEMTATTRPGADRGIGRYLDELVEALRSSDHQVLQTSSNMGTRRLAEYAALPGRHLQLLRNRPFDVFHAPTPYYMAATRKPVVVSVLDIIPLDLDAHVKTGMKARSFFRLAARADSVVTISHFSAARIAERLGVPEDRIFVAPLPVKPVFTPDGPVWSGRRPYVAAMIDLRTPDPRKRSHWLRSLAESLRRQGLDLLVVGSATENLAWSGAVGLGRIDDATWASVLRGARCFAYSSSYEGQGLPPLEAMSCGTPVVAMNNTSLTEVVAHAGVLVEEQAGDADGRDAFVEAVGELVISADLDAMSNIGIEHAATFSFERFRHQVDAAHFSAVGAVR